jgi:hypothetical protein
MRPTCLVGFCSAFFSRAAHLRFMFSVPASMLPARPLVVRWRCWLATRDRDEPSWAASLHGPLGNDCLCLPHPIKLSSPGPEVPKSETFCTRQTRSLRHRLHAFRWKEDAPAFDASQRFHAKQPEPNTDIVCASSKRHRRTS